jgi:hypothetical protein
VRGDNGGCHLCSCDVCDGTKGLKDDWNADAVMAAVHAAAR